MSDDSTPTTLLAVIGSLLGGGTLGVAARAWLDHRARHVEGERQERAAERDITGSIAMQEREERRALDAQIESMHVELRRLAIDVTRCQAEHEESKRDRAQLRAQVDLLEQQNARLKTSVEQLSDERDRACAERDEMLLQVRIYADEARASRDQVEALTRRVFELAGLPSTPPPSPSEIARSTPALGVRMPPIPAAPSTPRVAQTALDVRRYSSPGFRPPTQGEE